MYLLPLVIIPAPQKPEAVARAAVWDVSTGLVMLIGRFVPILAPIALAASLARKRPTPYAGRTGNAHRVCRCGTPRCAFRASLAGFRPVGPRHNSCVRHAPNRPQTAVGQRYP
ncbi:MAG: potassium-transporting ATPase subunit KdpA [Gemmataceae bacterium]